MNYYAKITFKVNENHPMFENSEKSFDFEDLYCNNNNIYNEDYMHDLIREDLLLVAGGENYSKSLSNVAIEIYQTSAKTLAEYHRKVNDVYNDLVNSINRDKLEKAIDLLISKI